MLTKNINFKNLFLDIIMTFKHFCYVFIKFMFVCLLLSSCQTPKYLKVKNFTNTKNIIPEVQYSLAENFNPNSVNCIAIGKIIDKSDANEYKSLDKITLVRHAVYGHLAPKNYQDIELHKVSFIMQSSKSNKLILQNLDCDALLEGIITEFKNNFYGVYSSTNVGLSLLLKDKDKPLCLPAYDQCIKASHIFNLLDARGVISVSERQSFILKVRNMSRSCCLAWMEKSNNE